MSRAEHQTIPIADDEASLLSARHIQSGVLLFHFLFRSLALLTYLFANWLVASFIISFLLIISFSSLDFWTVKNITGRKLVGLRWWNFVDENGQNHWKYESRRDNSDVNPYERQLFWAGLVGFPALWTVLCLVAFFTLRWSWLIVGLFASAMTASNLFGYLRCKWNSRQELGTYLKQGILKRVIFDNPLGSMLRRRGGSTPKEPTTTAKTLIDM